MEEFVQPKASARLFLVIVALFLIALVAGAAAIFVTKDRNASGKIISEDRELDAFTQVEIEGDMNLVFNQGEEQLVEVTAEEEIMPDIVTEISGSTLVIKRKNARFSFLQILPTKEISIVVTVPKLEKVSLAGSGKITSERYQGDAMELQISGSGDIALEGFEVGKLVAKISGSGDMDFVGKVDTQELAITGSGEINAKELVGKTVTAEISGSGNIFTNVAETLNAILSGSGNIEYVGEAKTINQDVTGSGEVKKSSN